MSHYFDHCCLKEERPGVERARLLSRKSTALTVMSTGHSELYQNVDVDDVVPIRRRKPYDIVQSLPGRSWRQTSLHLHHSMHQAVYNCVCACWTRPALNHRNHSRILVQQAFLLGHVVLERKTARGQRPPDICPLPRTCAVPRTYTPVSIGDPATNAFSLAVQT